MYSEFYNVALDRIRYSLVWESSTTLYHGLDIQPEDQLLVITSAGCNVLNALLGNPQSVTAIDLNPVQNKLLELKKHIILHHPYAVFRALLGLEGPVAVAQNLPLLEQSLPEEAKGFWSSFFKSHPEGLMLAGKLEGYLNGFIHTLDTTTQQQLRCLFTFDSLGDQIDFYEKALKGSSFQEQFIHYFDEANLSKGRDPRLFKYAADSGGLTFYKRLEKQIKHTILKSNFFSRFFFFGAESLEDSVLPPCYQEKNYLALRRQLHKLNIVTGEAVDYLLSEQGKGISKASLSNIFEYTSPEEFQGVCQKLLSKQQGNLRIIFWNLLQEQDYSSKEQTLPWSDLSAALSEQEACFYFLNVKVYETCAVDVHPPVSVNQLV